MRRAMCVLLTVAAVLATTPSSSVAEPTPIRVAIADDCAFSGGVFPGDSIDLRCEIVNGDVRDASFFYFIRQDNLTVLDRDDNVVTGPDRDTFIGFFRIGLATQPVLGVAFPPAQDPPNESDDVDVAKVPYPYYRTMCADRRLTELTGDPNDFDGTHCRIGRVRAREQPAPVGGFDRRGFELTLTMLDDGDQTRFAGWALVFTHVFRARVPAINDCPDHCGVQAGVVYER